MDAFFQLHGITRCEVCPALHALGKLTKPCISFLRYQKVHRNKRKHYWAEERRDLLGDPSQVALGCQNGHDAIENNEELREQVFILIRGK